MNFKNVKAYLLTQPLNLVSYALEETFAEFALRPCGNQETATLGFTPVLGTQFVHQANGYYTLKLTKEERLLPDSVVNDELLERIEAIEKETGAPVGKKAQQDLKQEIITRLLPQAFLKRTHTFGTIIPAANLVLVYASADGKAEAFLAMLRKVIGSLPVVPLARHSIASNLTNLVNEPLAKIDLLEQATLISTDELKSVISAKQLPLDSEEVVTAIDSGKLVSSIGLTYDDKVDFVLHDDAAIKRINFSDRLKEELSDIPKNEVAALIDAEIVLFVAEIVELIQYLDSQFSLTEDEAA